MTTRLLPIFILASLLTGCSSCSSLKPGADPIVVRTEQALKTGSATFDLVLSLDHADRGFWRTNAPAFHNFCEGLRAPQIVFAYGTNATMPRVLAAQWSLNQVKIAYKQSPTNSTALEKSLASFLAFVDQAAAWATIVTNRP